MKELLNIRELEILLDVRNTCNLSHSASNMRIAQANISRIITNIEERIGLEIFDRTVRPLQLTSFGSELLPFMMNHHSTYSDMVSFIESYKSSPAGTVRLSIPAGQLYFVSKYIIPEIHQRYPEINIDIHTSNLRTADYLDGVVFDDRCDIMFTHALPKNENLIAFKLAEIKCDIYCSHELLQRYHPVDPKQYGEFPCILFHAFMHDGDNIWMVHHVDSGRDIGLQVSGNITCDNVYTAIELAKAGLGFVFMPSVMLAEFELQHKLIPTLPYGYSAKIMTYVIYRRRRIQPVRVSIVIDVITRMLSNVLNYAKL